jgi:hypothetical protein
MKYFCLFFARGCCPYGWECEYLHALPDASCVLPDNSKDCFARDKFADYRDDMGGVGSFQRINRTLYIGRVKELGSGAETEEMVRRHFREWGEIEFSEYISSILSLISPSTISLLSAVVDSLPASLSLSGWLLPSHTSICHLLSSSLWKPPFPFRFRCSPISD